MKEIVESVRVVLQEWIFQRICEQIGVVPYPQVVPRERVHQRTESLFNEEIVESIRVPQVVPHEREHQQTISNSEIVESITVEPQEKIVQNNLTLTFRNTLYSTPLGLHGLRWTFWAQWPSGRGFDADAARKDPTQTWDAPHNCGFPRDVVQSCSCKLHHDNIDPRSKSRAYLGAVNKVRDLTLRDLQAEREQYEQRTRRRLLLQRVKEVIFFS